MGLLAIFTSGPAFAAAGVPTTPVATESSPPVAPQSARNVPSDTQEYAAREQATQAALETFTGGEGGVGIYIGSGALVAALLVVVILLLL